MGTWSDNDERDARIDAAIDEAARQMTTGAPRSDFRARVLARLDQRESIPFGRRLLWIAPIAAAIVIVLAAVIGRFDGGIDRRTAIRPVPPQPTQTATRSPESVTPAPAVETHAPATASVRPTPARRSNVDRSSLAPANAALAPRAVTSGLDTLATEALDVESIRLAPLGQAPSIRITPLETIDPIDVAPLAMPDGDDPQRREP